jgi:hypothetical protein
VLEVKKKGYIKKITLRFFNGRNDTLRMVSIYSYSKAKKHAHNFELGTKIRSENVD